MQDKVIDSPGGERKHSQQDVHDEAKMAKAAGDALREFVAAFPKAENVTVQNEAGSVTFRPKQPRDRIVKRG